MIFIGLGLLGQQALHGALTGPAALKVSGAVIIVMGVLFVLAPFVPRFSRQWHVSGLMARAGRGGPVMTGAAFALAWTPCTGPTLGAIITAAGLSGSAARGAFLLAVYCAGLAVPFLVTGLAFGTVTSALGVVRRHYAVVITAGGVVLIGMGDPDLDRGVHAAQHHREPLAPVAGAAGLQLGHVTSGRAAIGRRAACPISDPNAWA